MHQQHWNESWEKRRGDSGLGVGPRHDKSWRLVHEYVDRNLKVWSVKPEQAILPALLPWLEERMESMTFARVPNEEAFVVYACFPTMGVPSSMKVGFIHHLVTGFLTARPANAIAVVVHANRASEARKCQT